MQEMTGTKGRARLPVHLPSTDDHVGATVAPFQRKTTVLNRNTKRKYVERFAAPRRLHVMESLWCMAEPKSR